MLLITVISIAFAFIICKILDNPFHYPYFTFTFDVTGKRNVQVTDYIDRYLCSYGSWQTIENHQQKIIKWKQDSEAYLSHCHLKKRRLRQYQKTVDDEHAYRFYATRKQTRYTQQNYVRTPYKVSTLENAATYSYEWLVNRNKRLAATDFSCTLREYNSKEQRKLMTRALREQIMRRDNYTCQICGKYMPDEVGLQIDHIIPVSKGGKTVPSNLQVLCDKCNRKKSAKLA